MANIHEVKVTFELTDGTSSDHIIEIADGKSAFEIWADLQPEKEGGYTEAEFIEALTAKVNMATETFEITETSKTVTVKSSLPVNSVYLNGVLQTPGTTWTVKDKVVSFDENLYKNDTVIINLLK